MIRGRLELYLIRFAQWRQRSLEARVRRIDKRAAWWAAWTQRRLP